MRATKKKVHVERLAISGLVMVLAMLAGIAQASAPAYQNTYKGSAMSVQSSVISIQTVTPTTGFQSTSAYSKQWSNEDVTPMLNNDGSVNHEAYGIGQENTPNGHIRKAGGVSPEPEHEELPLGDGLLVLLVLAMMYAGAKVRNVKLLNR